METAVAVKARANRGENRTCGVLGEVAAVTKSLPGKKSLESKLRTRPTISERDRDTGSEDLARSCRYRKPRRSAVAFDVGILDSRFRGIMRLGIE